MTVKALAKKCGFDALTLPSPEREVCGVYIGDLLSWVMGRASSGNAWITIMSNVNIVAVALLADVSTIILSEDVAPDEDAKAQAISKGINLLSTKLSTYECALKIAEALS